jgi:hypothetical protein
MDRLVNKQTRAPDPDLAHRLGQMRLGPPKTEAGRREVPIPSNVGPVLIDHLDRFAGPGPDGWLFPGHDGSVISARTLDRQWSIGRKSIARPDLHFHDLRHTGLTLVATTGATTAEIMAAGGHDSPAAASRYQHATRERRTALAAMAEGRFESLSSSKGHARGTTPSLDVPDDHVSEPSSAPTKHSIPKQSVRRHRQRRRKSPGERTSSEHRPPPGSRVRTRA